MISWWWREPRGYGMLTGREKAKGRSLGDCSATKYAPIGAGCVSTGNLSRKIIQYNVTYPLLEYNPSRNLGKNLKRLK
jgi:hypothetical protein